jgi:glycosyltransferase involved in cell wall biosynthesis
MRILMISQFYPPIVGGEESMVQHLSQALARRGHDVGVATFGNRTLPAFDEDGPVKIYRIQPTVARLTALYGDDVRRHAPPGPDPEAVLALRHLVALHRPDIVHAHNWLVHSFIPIKWRCGVPLVVTLHDYSLVCPTKRLMYFGQPCSGPGFRKCMRCSAHYYGSIQGPLVALGQRTTAPLLKRATDLFMPVSRYVASRSELADGGVRYEVVPNFLPDAFFASRPVGEEIGGLPSGPFILFAGDLSHDKGVGILLDAHARMRSPIDLVLVGRPPDLELKTPPGVHVLPPVPRALMPEAWSRCAIAVVPSLVQETFGLVALEAMMAGRATVVTSAGNLSDLVTDGETGFVVPPGDPALLAVALDRLASDGGLRSRLGDAARRSAAAYSESAVLPQLERLYASVRPRGAPTA